VRQTIKQARGRLRQIAYQVGCNGRQDMVYSLTAWSPGQAKVVQRTGSYGVVQVPWKHPAYWYPDGTPIPDEL
jgi:hypothetical protein